MAVSRGVPLLSESIAITTGLVAMPRRRFATSSIAGSVSVGVVYGVAGAVADDHWAVLPLALLGALAANLVVRRFAPA